MKHYLIVISIILLSSCFSRKESNKPADILSFELIADSLNSSIRGISIIDSDIWFSGSGGKVFKISNDSTIDVSPINCEALDFRSIYTLDNQTAFILSAGSPALLMKTENGGLNWFIVYSDSSKSIFYNAIDFWNAKEGIAFGDPINNRFSIFS